jgi:hypothetical protein
MNRSLLRMVGLIATAIYLASCCPKNPPLNVVKTAHGNTDWHIDTAEEFLTGKDMNGNTLAANHCPDTWTKTHMHVGLTNTNGFYYDSSVVASGQDTDSTSGIDRPMLFFYAGHGEATDFSALGSDALVSSMRLGNCSGSNDGTLRYYWQCSCEVFAHGPQTCATGSNAYSCPGAFDGSADSDAMRNVYERWGSRLDPALRMACGSSTLAYCWQSETNKIWDDYNNKGYDVADSFIDGLHRYTWNTPLCITTGGLSTFSTPLVDTAFTNAPNPSGAYYHIQYLSSFATTAPTIKIEIPETIPVFELIPPPPPETYRKYRFTEQGDWMSASEQVRGRGSVVKINRNSGALYLFGERRMDEKAGALTEEEYVKAAERIIREQGWTEEKVSQPNGYRMLVQTSPKEGGRAEIRQIQKNVVVTFKREITVDGKSVAVLGEGGVMSFQLNNDGSVVNASKVWRTIKGVLRTTKSKSYEQAYEEALTRIREKEAYTLADWMWGYEEAAGNVKQTELKAFYVFNFLPRDLRKGKDYPPVIVKVSAHLE